MPQLIDIATPDSAKTRKGFDGQDYELVFSDEFEIDGRTFFPGDDPYWEAVDLSYRATADLEWYHPNQITTKGGKLSILMENVANHGLKYRSGMLQSWNKFCFVSGYIEVSMTLPGPDQETMGYVSFGAICFVCFALLCFFVLLISSLSPSGLGHGQWETWEGPGMEHQRTVYGLTRASPLHPYMLTHLYTHFPFSQLQLL